MHCVGHQSPSYVVGLACETLGISLDKGDRVAHLPSGPGLEVQTSKKGKNTQVNDLSASNPELTQAAIDTQAREAIIDIPELQ